MDTDGFRVSPDVAIFHNRHKFVNRLRLLHAFALGGQHCSPSLHWRQTDANCCEAGNASRGRHGGVSSPWPLHFASRRGCHAMPLVDLRNQSVQQQLGIASALEGKNIRQKA